MLRTFAILSLVACAHESADPPSRPGPGLKPPTVVTGSGSATTAPTADLVTVELTAVTLADHCGNTMPDPPKPAPAAGARPRQRAEMDAEPRDRARRAQRGDVRCEQTSMQLAITVAAQAPATTIAIKSAQLFDEKHAVVGTLATRSPAKWNARTSIYEAWNEQLAGGETAQVTYLLAPPDWSKVPDRWNQTFTLEVTVAVAGADRTVTQVVTVQQATALPPNVRT